MYVSIAVMQFERWVFYWIFTLRTIQAKPSGSSTSFLYSYRLVNISVYSNGKFQSNVQFNEIGHVKKISPIDITLKIAVLRSVSC